jgi:hypothetical protein
MQNIRVVLFGKLTSQLDEFFMMVIRDCSVIDQLLPASRGKVGVQRKVT